MQSANTKSGSSKAVASDAALSKQGKAVDVDEAISKLKDLSVTMFNEEYAARKDPGSKGQEVQSRVNYFEIKPETLPEKIHVYSLGFPQLHNRELKNPLVKKDFVHQVLRSQFIQSSGEVVVTDWQATLLSYGPLEDLPGWGSNDRSKSIQVTYAVQPSGPQAQAAQPSVSINPIKVLYRSDLLDFVRGRKSSDCSLWFRAINILARQHANDTMPGQRSVKVGADKFFSLSVADGGSWPAWLHPRNGYFSSVRPIGTGLAMNVRAVSGVFITHKSLGDLACDYLGPAFASASSRTQFGHHDDAFKKFFKGLRVRRMYQPSPTPGQRSKRLQNERDILDPSNKPKRISGFGGSAVEQKFDYGNPSREISVQKYFNDHVLPAGQPLQWPQMLVANVGNADHPVWIPTELLYVEPHQPYLPKLNEQLVKEMIKVAQRPADKTAIEIQKAPAPQALFDANAIQQSTGMFMERAMMRTKGRMLDIPLICYANEQKQGGGKARQGNWNLDGKNFVRAVSLGRLGVIELSGCQNPINLYQALSNGLKYGITRSDSAGPAVARVEPHLKPNIALNNALNKLRNEGADTRAVLVIIPAQQCDDHYAKVKFWSDTVAGIVTICIKSTNAGKLTNYQFQGNLALKFNVKAGGVNHGLSKDAQALLHGNKTLTNQATLVGKSVTPGKPAAPNNAKTTMVVGIDVTHPGAGSVKHCPSIAAVVASCDREAVSYPGSLRLQKSKQEELEGLDDMIKERLDLWRKKVGALPDNLLIYRDGVSESQFINVRNHELRKIQGGCDKAKVQYGQPSWDPKITLIVGGKRHQTRFMPLSPVPQNLAWAIDCKAGGKSTYNWLPGFVADEPNVRPPYLFDFFLQSHKAIKGTARPCHYYVIHNGMDLSANDMQAITFNLCWIFARSTTAVSYAAPAYYADRLAERGRCYLRRMLTGEIGESEVLKGMTIDGDTSDDEKDIWVSQQVAQGHLCLWPSRSSHQDRAGANPHHVNLEERMFYI